MKKNLLYILLFVLSLQANSQTPPAYIPTNGLIAWYPFENDADDQSGNDNNATYIGSGVTPVADRMNNDSSAYHFDGAAGSYIRIPADSFPTTDRTVSLWFNVPSVSNRPMLMGYGGGGCSGNGSSFLMGLNSSGNGSYSCQAHYGSNPCNYAYATDPLNEWINWIITISGSTIEMYVNGALVSTSESFTYPTIVTGTDLSFGVMPWCDGVAPYTDPNGDYLQGDLDDIAIWKRTLSATEIQEVYSGNVTGVKETVNSNSIFVYPNPACETIMLRSSISNLGNKYIVRDVTGRIVLTGILNNEETKVDIHALTQGMYFLSNENGNATKKFIKE